MAESRTRQRFPLQLPIRMRSGRAAGAAKGKATTRDLSAAGVFIQADPSLRVGAQVRFNITLPHKLLGVPRDVDVECEGRVVRVEKPARGPRARKDGRVGLACVIDRYTFLRRN